MLSFPRVASLALPLQLLLSATGFRKPSRNRGKVGEIAADLQDASENEAELSNVCGTQWWNRACSGWECHTCGERITWLVNTNGMSMEAAGRQVAGEFPSECGQCGGSSPSPTPPPSSPTPPGAQSASTFLQWNVHWQNRDLNGIADVISKTPTRPDIVGLCEFTANTNDMARALSQRMGRNFKVQASRGGWKGYGTDIFYDDGKWEELEDGVQAPSCSSLGGSRASNWVVLRERQTGKKVITGGIHLSYCSNGCDGLHQCELGHLYDKLEAMKQRHGDAAVIWMGDLNRGTRDRIFQDLLQGRVGGRQVFRIADAAQTVGNTYYSGGSAIDFILGDAGRYNRKRGGRTGQGTTGQWLVGADHFPIYADVDLL